MGEKTSAKALSGQRSGFDLLPRGRGRTAVVAIMALAGGFLATVVFGDASASLLSALVGMFAILGAYAAVIGLRRASEETPEEVDLLGIAALAASGEAMAVVEQGERVVEANVPYRRLSRAGATELPTPESFLARIPGTQTAVAELLNAVAEERPHQMSLSYDAADPARRLIVSVHPLGSARRVLWTLRFPPDAASAAEGPAGASVAAAGARLGTEHEDAVVAAWERAPAGIVRLSSDRARLPNTTFCRLLGYGLADWAPAGVPLEEVIAPEDLNAVRAALSPTAGPASLKIRLVTREGGRLNALMRLGAPGLSSDATAVVIQDDAVVASAAIPLIDEATAAAMAGDLFFQRAPLALALIDGAGRIRAANGAFDRLFGSPAADRSAETTLAQLTAERDADAIAGLLEAARTGAAPAPCEVAPRAASGGTARLFAAALGGGEIALCAIDTTEQKALEAQFAESQKLQAVGHLAGGVAHDFNNLLTAIIGYCDLLLAKHRPSDPSFPDIMQIKQNANRAAGLVRQLLAFSRRQTLRPQVIELTDVLADVSQLLRRLIGERITLEVAHGRDLWPVKVDVNQFEQVIINLAVNARDAMPDGGTLTVRTRNVPREECPSYGQGLAPADYVLVEVEDTGTGIPPEIMDKIFEPFFSTKEVGKGTGLGLSTVYGILQQTGGTILAASVEGQGTTFRVFLPRHEAGAEEEAPVKEPEAKAADLTGHGTVLLVEDEDAVRAFASRALMGRGYDVLTAASGQEALAVMEESGRKVDLVVSDVVMPEMDGPTLLKELRARDPGLKVIFISGYAEEAFARNLPPTEQFSFLPKPFSLKQLVAAVGSALRG